MDYAFGIGIRRKKNGKTLDVLYPSIAYQSAGTLGELLLDTTQHPRQNGMVALDETVLQKILDFYPDPLEPEDQPHIPLLRDIASASVPEDLYSEIDHIVYFMFEGDKTVESAEEAYFKLQLLSQRHVQPHGVSLDGAFGCLTNVAWTSIGPVLPEDLPSLRQKMIYSSAPLTVTHIDKFPYLVNYHIPSGVRIADGSRVRLGAYLGEGCTVMPAGYVNFNAGSEGNTMIEGRVSAGVFVSKDSDIGGGASIMGTLSGGNDLVISVGSNCLLGANSGTGISLGFGCTIAAGLYIYSGMKVSLLNDAGTPVDLDGNQVELGQNCVKAMALSGRDHLLFIQDSQTGEVICKPNPKTITLNSSLHQND